MRPGPAVVVTILVMLAGIAICTVAAHTPGGRALLNVLNTVAFFAGIAYMIMGGQQRNVLRIGFGLLLVISAVGHIGLPQPIEAGAQLFLAVGGAFIRAPRGPQ